VKVFIFDGVQEEEEVDCITTTARCTLTPHWAAAAVAAAAYGDHNDNPCCLMSKRTHTHAQRMKVNSLRAKEKNQNKAESLFLLKLCAFFLTNVKLRKHDHKLEHKHK
jgi:hypothetical protein